jgi:glutathione S-transferase
MIKIHHLNFSRSTRIIWLMEEIGAKYEIVAHARDPQTFRSPPSLAEVHTLAKAPVIEDGALVLVESGAIIEYLLTKYGNGQLVPPTDDPAWAHYLEWLHFVEGSAMFPLLTHLLGILTGGLPDGLKGFITPDIGKSLTYVADAVQGGGWLLGELFSGADIQMSYLLEIADMGGLLGGYPALFSYKARLEQRPGYQRALAVGGPMRLPIG